MAPMFNIGRVFSYQWMIIFHTKNIHYLRSTYLIWKGSRCKMSELMTKNNKIKVWIIFLCPFICCCFLSLVLSWTILLIRSVLQMLIDNLYFYRCLFYFYFYHILIIFEVVCFKIQNILAGKLTLLVCQRLQSLTQAKVYTT